MTPITLRAVRSAGYKGGWKWEATLSGGNRVNASAVYTAFMLGSSMTEIAIAHPALFSRIDAEDVIRAMMLRDKK